MSTQDELSSLNKKTCDPLEFQKTGEYLNFSNLLNKRLSAVSNSCVFKFPSPHLFYIYSKPCIAVVRIF